MRKLTIKRQKSFVGCLAALKVCIEDHISPDMEINNLPCRMLGKLKNGEEVEKVIHPAETYFSDEQDLSAITKRSY